MARFERSGKSSRDRNERRYSGNKRSSDGDSRGSRSFNKRYDEGRDSGRNYNRREVEMTKVICSSCGVECEVPFKPNSDKPIFCNDCFAKNGKGSSDRGPRSSATPNKSLDIINEKLDKIMKALKIE